MWLGYLTAYWQLFSKGWQVQTSTLSWWRQYVLVHGKHGIILAVHGMERATGQWNMQKQELDLHDKVKN